MIKQQGGACRGILLNNYSSIVYSSSEKLFSLKHHFTLWTKGTHFMARRYLNTIWSEQFYDLNIDFFSPFLSFNLCTCLTSTFPSSLIYWTWQIDFQDFYCTNAKSLALTIFSWQKIYDQVHSKWHVVL